MNVEVQRRNLKMQYHQFASILQRKGIIADVYTEEELDKMEISDLQNLVRELRDVARTPIE